VPGLLRKKQELGLRFSEEGFRELLQFHDGVRELVEIAVASIATWDRTVAVEVLEKRKDLVMLERRFQLDHLARLRAGNPRTRETTSVHVNALNDMKQIASHTKRIANAVLGKVHEPPEADGADVRNGED
jgi:phosphate:Na+ symporter